MDVVESILEGDSILSEKRKKEQIRVIDVFSGTSRVGHALKQRGFFVISGDIMHYAYTIAKALIEADYRIYSPKIVCPLLKELNQTPGQPDWFTDYYAIQSRFFKPHNAAKIEAIRKKIDLIHGNDETMKSILLTSLLIAADKVDSTTGVQMAYLKNWAPRSNNSLHLEYPPILSGLGKAILGDALVWTKDIIADIAYLDPPYNQHSYAGNYHIWETLVLYDKPEVYGVARKRIDTKHNKSVFNYKKEAPHALRQLILNLQVKYIILSFSNEGFFNINELKSICEERGPTLVFEKNYKRYVGAQIGVYNPNGIKVSEPTHLYNTEYLFVICPDTTSQENIDRIVKTKNKLDMYII